MISNRRGIPLFFIPVMMLSGTGMGMALYVWFRMYTNLFGIHRFAVSSVLLVMLLCLGYGGRIGGRLADKARDSLVIFIVLQALAGLYSLFDPLIFSRLTALSMIIWDMHPSAFRMGIIRILLCFLFLSIPLFSFGGLLPALGRRFASQSDWAGSRLSIILSSVFTGLFTGLALAGFLLIPGYGMKQTMLISSLVSLFAFVLSLAYIIAKKSLKTGGEPAGMTKRSGKSPMLFRKRKIVLETIGKLTRAMLRTNVLHSFTVVSLLIISARLMSAYSTIGFAYLHILVLLVFFAGIVLGNLFFRTINTRTVNGYLVLASLEILTGFTILFGYVLFTVIALPLQMLSLDARAWNTRMGYHLILIASLVFVPAFSTGIILPLTGGMYTRLARKTGRNLGKLIMQYYAGALVAILLTYHVLLPIAGSIWSFFLILVFMIFSGIYLLIRDSRLIRGFRFTYAAIVLMGMTGVLFFLSKTGWIGSPALPKNGPMTHKHEGSSAIAGLLDMELGPTTLVINGLPDLETGKEGLLVQQIPAILACVTGQPVDASLVIGFGMGLTAAMLEASQSPHIIISEIYPEVISLSAEVFAEENNDILTSSFVDISHEDARLFLLRDSSRFNLVTSGYTHVRLAPGFYNREFYRTCSGRLAQHGLLTQVLPLRGIDLPEFRSLVKSCTSIFPLVSLWYLTPDRVLLVARKDDSEPGFCSFAGQFQKVVTPRVRATLGIPDPESLLGRQMMDNRQLRAFVEGAPENTNDRPFVEFSKTVPRFRDPMLIEELVRRMRPAGIPADASGCRHDTVGISLKVDQVQQAIREDLQQVTRHQ